MFKTIVWATDGSELADRALEDVVKLAKIHGARIVAVHANEVLPGRFGGWPAADEPDIRAKLQHQVYELRASGVDARLEIRSGTEDAAKLVERAAEEVGADLIVVGTHGRGAVGAALTGSFARRLFHLSRRSVLLVYPNRAFERSDGEARQLKAV
jgi:nucleotide-binding universal stress UspA family protein